MSSKSSPTRYGKVAVTMHWLSAILILVLIGTGFRAGSMVDPVAKAAILRAHLPVGIAILLLTLLRIGWWAFVDTKPAPTPMPAWQSRTSQLVHLLFYVVILGMAASGVGMILLSGAGPAIFDSAISVLPDFNDYPPRTPHGIGARLLIVLVAFHSVAAIYHQVIKKDGAIGRMWFRGEKSA